MIVRRETALASRVSLAFLQMMGYTLAMLRATET